MELLTSPSRAIAKALSPAVGSPMRGGVGSVAKTIAGERPACEQQRSRAWRCPMKFILNHLAYAGAIQDLSGPYALEAERRRQRFESNDPY